MDISDIEEEIVFFLEDTTKVAVTDVGNLHQSSAKIRDGYKGHFERDGVRVEFKTHGARPVQKITLALGKVSVTHINPRTLGDLFYSMCKARDMYLPWKTMNDLENLMGLRSDIYKKLTSSICVRCGNCCKTAQQLATFSEDSGMCRKCNNLRIFEEKNKPPTLTTVKRINMDLFSGEKRLFESAKEIIKDDDVSAVLRLGDLFLGEDDGISFDIDDVDASGYSLLHYAVKSNQPNVVRWLVDQRKADVDNLSEKGEHALLLALLFLSEPEPMLTVLLSKRANPCFVPKDLVWPSGAEELKKAPSIPAKTLNQIKYYFENDEFKKKLRGKMGLTSIYILRRAYSMLFLKPTAVEIIKSMEMEPLVEIFLNMVGQTLPIRRFIMSMISSQIIVSTRNSPNVFLFAGHSGHGKTFLAKTVAEKLHCESIVISCGSIRRIEGMFGGVAPYQGYQNGSDLNNFLASNSSRKSIVLLDEFDKIETKEIYNGFLELFESGNGHDNRLVNNNKVNCRNTIWILTTNIANNDIDQFVLQTKLLSQDPYFFDVDKRTAKQSADFDKLENTIRKTCKASFGKPIASRIKHIVPFLPFCRQEQIVLIDQRIHALQKQYALSESVYQHEKIYIKDLKVEALLNEDMFDSIIEFYDEDAGVRSIINCVDYKLHRFVCEQYLSEKLRQGDSVFIAASDDAFEIHKSRPSGFIRIKI